MYLSSTSHARGLPLACPSSSSTSVPRGIAPTSSLQDIVEDEMKGLEDLVPPVPELEGKDDGASGSDTPRRKQRG